MCSPGQELLFSVQGTQNNVINMLTRAGHAVRGTQNNMINMLPQTGPAARDTQNNMINMLPCCEGCYRTI